MSIAEIRPCTTLAPRFPTDLVQVENQTSVEEFRLRENTLTQMGLKLNQGNRAGTTAYFFAARYKNIAVLDYLCTKAQPQWLALGNFKGFTPLHALFLPPTKEPQKKPSIVYTLLTYGAPINSTTGEQWTTEPRDATPLDMALHVRDLVSACILKFNGGLCNLRHSDKLLNTLHAIVSQKEREVTELSKEIDSYNLVPLPLVNIITKYAVSEFQNHTTNLLEEPQ